MDPNERFRALDMAKILMGIYSEKPIIKRFQSDSKVWAKL
jgi:hypothetical protein